MFSGLLQDWTTVDGAGTTPFAQGRSDWLDLCAFVDVTFWLEVRAVSPPGAGNVVLAFETAPATEESLFLPMASVTLAASSAPVVTRVQVSANPTVSLARFVRWNLAGTASGNWSVTFRVFAMANKGSGGSFDPSSLALTGWWRGSFAASPWVATASAGTSGVNTPLAEATNPPTVGTSLNGFAPASFDGVIEKLTAAGTLGSYYSTTAYSGWALVNITHIGTNDPVPYENDCIWCTLGNAYASIFLRDDGLGTVSVGAHHFDGSDRFVLATITTATWALVQWKYDGSNIYLRVNSGAWQSVAAGSIGSVADAFMMGTNYTVTKFFDGLVEDGALSNTAFSDATFDGIKNYINVRYGLSL